MALTLRQLRIQLMEAENFYGPNAPVVISPDGVNTAGLVVRLHDARHPDTVLILPIEACAPTRQLTGVATTPTPAAAAAAVVKKSP